jgi:hypothetical protein
MDEPNENILRGAVKREYGVAICSNRDVLSFGDIFLSKTTIGTRRIF